MCLYRRRECAIDKAKFEEMSWTDVNAYKFEVKFAQNPFQNIRKISDVFNI